MRAMILAILFSMSLLTGCAVTIRPPTITGPDFSQPQKNCVPGRSSTSGYSNRSGDGRTAGIASSDEKICTWIDSSGRVCTSRSVWRQRSVTVFDPKTKKNVPKTQWYDDFRSDCR
jgi:hypothetical protein